MNDERQGSEMGGVETKGKEAERKQLGGRWRGHKEMNERKRKLIKRLKETKESSRRGKRVADKGKGSTRK